MTQTVATLALVLTGLATGCGVFRGLPEPTTLEQRLARMPTRDLPLRGPVTIHWNDHQVPFIEAEHDEDLAFALGMVHAHLRLGQLELFRRLSQGRLSESAGPFATDIDLTLRILDFGKAAARIEASLPDDTRAWLTAFASGLNHYQRRLPTLPTEFAVLGIDPEPWTVRDLLTINRLIGSDVNWLGWSQLLALRDHPEWATLWPRIRQAGGGSTLSFEGSKNLALENLLGGTGRNGSNAIAVAPARTKSGGAIIAGDPHLGFVLPNLWLLVGMRSPSYHAVGFMIPGVPAVAVGRNQHIAWGGTNMRSASTELIEVRDLSKLRVTERTVRIKRRWWRTRRFTARDTELGPVVSDAPLFDWKKDSALVARWVGHETSDEVSALLGVNRARNFQEFRQAFSTFAVSGQNYLYADTQGNIGQVMAVRLPDRPPTSDTDFITPVARHRWSAFRDATSLPVAFNPAKGYLASANNRPAATPVPVGDLFSADDRVDRLGAIIERAPPINIGEVRRLQADVCQASSIAVRDAIASAMRRASVAATTDGGRRLVLALVDWDGCYETRSRGALAFELLFATAFEQLYSGRFLPGEIRALAGLGSAKTLFVEDLNAAPDSVAGRALTAAIETAGERFTRYENWGAIHRLELAHPLGNAPIIGGKFRFGDRPVAGSSDTLQKSAHGLIEGPHASRFGAQARHYSDLSDPNENYFVLLGGQDGWFRSSTFLDQADLFFAGEYIRMPLEPNEVRRAFGRTTVHRPAP